MHRLVVALFVCGIALVRAQSGEEQEEIDLPLTFSEWFVSSSDPLTPSGIVHLQLQNIFMNPNSGGQMVDGAIRKPARGSYAIAVNPSDECEGVFVTQAWVMTLKDTTDVEGASPNFLYFVQEGTDWYSNEAGFLYGYDSEICPQRNFTAQVLVGGRFVQDVFDAPNVETPEQSG